MLILRVHHLLCTGFFSGHGYSPEYTEHLKKTIASFKSQEAIVLTTNCDTVCSACPKQKHNGTELVCDEDDNHVHIKDSLLLESLGLEEGRPYKVTELKKLLDKNLTEDVFVKSCANCQWFKQGFCYFERWKNPLNFDSETIILDVRNQRKCGYDRSCEDVIRKPDAPLNKR